MSRRLWVLPVALVLVLNVGVAASYGGVVSAPVAFTAEKGTAGVHWDSGWQGLWPIHVRFDFGVNGDHVYATLPGTGYVTWSSPGKLKFLGSSNAGRLRLDGGVGFSLKAKLDLPLPGFPIEFPIPYVPNFDLRWDSTQAFTPFLLDSSVTVSSSFGGGKILDVPLSPIPGLGGGVTVLARGEISGTMSGHYIYVSSTSGSGYITTEGGSLNINPTGSSYQPTVTYNESFVRTVTLIASPGVYVEFLFLRWDLPVFDIRIPILSGQQDLPFNTQHPGFSFPVTQFPVVSTQCPVVNTECPASNTTCPRVNTQCPGSNTTCPTVNTHCPPSNTTCPTVNTQCPASNTTCPTVNTQCPASNTTCPRVNTQCPVVTTQCPAGATACPVVSTNCPVTETECPAQATECPEVVTQCPESPTSCPEEGTQCPEEMTWCPEEGTACPEGATACPAVNTECPATNTTCPTVNTQCPEGETTCPEMDTTCPEVQTECPEVSTECLAAETQCPAVATQCPPTQTQCPVVVTQCPSHGGADWEKIDLGTLPSPYKNKWSGTIGSEYPGLLIYFKLTEGGKFEFELKGFGGKLVPKLCLVGTTNNIAQWKQKYRPKSKRYRCSTKFKSLAAGDYYIELAKQQGDTFRFWYKKNNACVGYKAPKK